MRLWRVSSARHARDFDGGYGLLHSGRWNTPPRPVTYCSTSPALALLEKRVHSADPVNLPHLALVEYDAPDDLPERRIERADLPADWTRNEIATQSVGDTWLDEKAEALLIVPSVILPFDRIPDRNVVVNHHHPATTKIRRVEIVSFSFDLRLFDPR